MLEKRFCGKSTWRLPTVQPFNSCTSRPDVCQCLVAQTPMANMSKIRQAHQWPTELANQSYAQLGGHLCIHAQESWWQSDVQSCVMLRLPTDFVQELNVGSVQAVFLPYIMRSPWSWSPLRCWWLILPKWYQNCHNTRWCKESGKWLKPWHMGTHLGVLSERIPINTNKTGFGWLSKIFAFLCFGRDSHQNRKG